MRRPASGNRACAPAGRPGWHTPAAPLNELDERIVHALAADARRSYADVGAEVGLSASAVKRRVDRLLASGAIRGFTGGPPV